MNSSLIVIIAIFVFLIGLGILYRISALQGLFNFLHDGLSIDETKVSLFMVMLVISATISFYFVFQFGDIPNNLLNFDIALISAIGAVNITKSIMKERVNPSPIVQTMKDLNKEINQTNLGEK